MGARDAHRPLIHAPAVSRLRVVRTPLSRAREQSVYRLSKACLRGRRPLPAAHPEGLWLLVGVLSLAVAIGIALTWVGR